MQQKKRRNTNSAILSAALNWADNSTKTEAILFAFYHVPWPSRF